MADNRQLGSIGGPPYGDETRTVSVRLKDSGKIVDIRNVPKAISDSEIEKKYSARVLGPVSDAVESAVSGFPFAISQLISLPGKLNAGLGYGLGLRSKEESQKIAKDAQSFDELVTNSLGGNYAPRTTVGKYLKSGTAAAVPLPGTTNKALQAGLGFTSGVLGQGASDAGLGTPGVVAASLAPYLAAGVVSLARPRSSVDRMKNSLSSMTPEDRQTMSSRLDIAKENNLPVMPWQMAPEGSELRQLGKAVAGQEQAYAMRRMTADQAKNITGTADLIPELRKSPASSRISGPLYQESAKVPLSSSVAENIRNSILAIKKEKNLAPNSPQSKVIEKIADQFGESTQISGSQMMEQLAQEASKYKPGSPEHSAIRKQVADIFSGKAEAKNQFNPSVTNYGELQNIYQNMKLPDGLVGLDVDKATKAWIRGAIAKVADADNPLFKQARDVFGNVKSVESAVLDSMPARHGVNASAVTETLPEIMYAGATTPLWAAVPIVRNIGKKALINDYQKYLMASDPAALSKLANRTPIGSAAELMRLGILSPVKQGEVDISKLTE